MRRIHPGVIGLGVGATLFFVLFAPTFYWYSYSYSPLHCGAGSCTEWKVYRSIGCMVFSYGDTYFDGGYWGGLHFSCGPAPPIS